MIEPSPSTLALAQRLHDQLTAEIAAERDHEDAVAFGIDDSLWIERTVSTI